MSFEKEHYHFIGECPSCGSNDWQITRQRFEAECSICTNCWQYCIKPEEIRDELDRRVDEIARLVREGKWVEEGEQ